MLKRTKNKWIGGVCGGIAQWMGIDPTIIRLLTAITLCFYGVGFWLYILAWMIIPSE